MYANQALKNLERFKKNWSRLSENITTEEYKMQLDRAMKFLRTSFQFYLGGFEKIDPLLKKFFYNEKLNILDLFRGPKLNLPYPTFTLCWYHPYEDKPLDILLEKIYGKYDLRHIAIVNQESDDVISIQSVTFDPDPQIRGWFLSPVISFFTFKEDIKTTEFYKRFQYLDKDIEISPVDASQNFLIGTTVSSEIGDELLNDPAAIKVRWTEAAVVNMFLIMSNSPNITTQTIHKVKVKKQRKAKINRLLSYLVLGVKMPSNKNKYRYDKKPSRENKGIMPINWYKGHLKTYTEDAPLFGKWVGSWWWQPNVRGSKTAGFTDKDYCVQEINA